MSLKKILLFSSDTLLSSAIHCLILGDQELEVISLPSEDLGRLVSATRELKPDAVILEQKLLTAYSGLLNHLLKGETKTRVITLDEDQNILHVYSGHRVSVEQSSDLLSILHSNNPLV